MRSAVAGTFNILHDGHKALIERAFALGDSVLVGITSDRMAAAGRDDIVPLQIRRAGLVDHLDRFGKPYTLAVIEDAYGPAEMDSVDILVVSPETLGNAEMINASRAERGIAPMELVVVSLVKACDGEKISAGRILDGIYARDGRRDVPDIAVGSVNRVKTEAVRTVMERIFGEVRITAVAVDPGVPPQPFGEQTRTGAVNRAKGALGGHDLAVGIEAGVFETQDGLYDFQYCAVVDREGNVSVGVGMGFRYPDGIAALVRDGCTVGDAVHRLYGDADIGKGQGAIGLLSKGLIDRKTLTEQSVTAAMIPRIRDE